MDPIVGFLVRGEVPEDKKEAAKLIRKAAWFVLIEGQLYRRGFNLPLLKCLAPPVTERVLEEIHEGISGHHLGGRSLERKTIRAGYFWPTMGEDSKRHVQRCDQCQKFASIYRAPPEELFTISSPWPFYKWGMDILGPFPKAAGGIKYLIVAADYFTKWIEVEPVATITARKVEKFFFRKIVCRFGIPAIIITDNGTQFIDKRFREEVANLGVKHHFSAVEHPQMNGQVESANKILTNGLKKRVEGCKGKWLDELDSVLWGYRTSIQSSTQETPFKMTYGFDAMLPVEVGEPSWRKKVVEDKEITNEELMNIDLNLWEEEREKTSIIELASKQTTTARYNQAVVKRSFQVGDLVLRRVDVGKKNATDGKLAANWKGPYRVIVQTNSGAYQLQTLEGKAIPRY